MAATMHPATVGPQLAESTRQFEEAKTTLQRLVTGLTDDEFNRRPAEGQWSVGEITDHLCVLARLVLPKLNVAIESGRRNSRFATGHFRYGFLSRYFIRMVGPRPNRDKGKMRAPRIYLPGNRFVMTDKVAEFNAIQDELVACALSANGLHLARIKVASPVTRLIRVSLGAWFEAIAAHQHRHFDQIQEVRQSIRT